MNIQDKNISRFSTIVSKIESLYASQHKESDIELQHRCGYLPFCHTGGDFEKDSQGRLDHLHGKFMLFGKLPDLPERDREISPYGERQTALRLVIGGIRAIGGIGVIEALRGIRALGAL